MEAMIQRIDTLRAWASKASSGLTSISSLAPNEIYSVLDNHNLSFRIAETYDQAGTKCIGISTVLVTCTDAD